MKSTIAAFLMSIPLSAIGLMAVFGIPQMAPGSLFQKTQEEDVLRGDYFEDEEVAETPRKRKSRSAAPRFEDNAPAFDSDSHASRRAPARSSHADEWNDQEAPAASDGADPFPRKAPGQAARNRNASSHNHEPASDSFESGPRERISQSRTDLTWKGARNRLTELGVTHFHLERGSTDDSFLFVCMFSPGDDPRVTRRFEAEAPDPLAAVDGVLGQIDTWMQRRFANQSQVGFNR